jgi:hypothetical protein
MSGARLSQMPHACCVTASLSLRFSGPVATMGRIDHMTGEWVLSNSTVAMIHDCVRDGVYRPY